MGDDKEQLASSLRLRDRLYAVWDSYRHSAGLPVTDRLADARVAFQDGPGERRAAEERYAEESRKENLYRLFNPTLTDTAERRAELQQSGMDDNQITLQIRHDRAAIEARFGAEYRAAFPITNSRDDYDRLEADIERHARRDEPHMSDREWAAFVHKVDRESQQADIAYRRDPVNSQGEGRLNQTRGAESYAKLDEHAKVIWQNWVNKETPSRAAGLAQTPTIRHVNKIGM